MSLKKQLSKGTAWMGIAASLNSVTSFFIFIFLSRILEPQDIGLVAFALIIVEVGKIIVNAGFPLAIVQNPNWDEVNSSTCFYLNLLLATFLTLIIFFVGTPLVAHYYRPEAGPILQALSVIFFIEGAKAVHEGKLKREFSFRVIALRTIVGGVVSGVIGVGLALKGFGVWALVWQQIINHFIVSFLTIRSAKWMPSLAFSLTDCKQLIKFSTPLMTAQLIGNVTSKIFEVLIGVIIGPAALGFYRVGGRALYIIQDIVIKPFENTLLSALSRMNDKAAQAFATLRIFHMSGYIAFPIFFGAAAIAPEFISLAFGTKWEPSGNIMTILALGIAPQIIGNHVNSALTASGNSKLVMLQSGIDFIIIFVLGVLIIPYGILATAYAFSISSYCTILFSLYLFKKIFAVKISSILNSVYASLLAAIIMFAVIMLIKHWAMMHIVPLVRLVMVFAMGAIVYALLMALIFRNTTKLFLNEALLIAPETQRHRIRKLQTILRLS